MDYSYLEDDELIHHNHKFKKDYDDDENLNFLNQHSSMGRGIPANYMQADDATQLKLINEARSKFFDIKTNNKIY